MIKYLGLHFVIERVCFFSKSGDFITECKSKIHMHVGFRIQKRNILHDFHVTSFRLDPSILCNFRW